MSLPEIVLPKIEIPFHIPLLAHPPIVHFLIAIPVIVLLLEILNLMMKKKAVGGVSFLLLLLVMVAAIGAYFAGLTDGKEAYPALNEAAKAALTDHKQLGAYILLGSGVVFVLKLFSMLGNKFLKALYILILILFLVLLFKQGKEGGELVYIHGINVEQVKNLDDELFDANEELEEAQEDLKDAQEALKNKKEIEVPVVENPVTTETITNSVSDSAIPETISKDVKSNTESTLETTIEKKETEVKSVATETVKTETLETNREVH